MAIKDFHVLIPRNCEYITLYGRRGFANMMELKGEGEIILDCYSESNVLIREKKEDQNQKEEM